MNRVQFILFLDPENGNFYSYSEDKQMIIKETPPQSLSKLIYQDIKTVKQLRKQIGFKWKQFNSFQIRPIPVSFLTPRKFRYPIYNTQQAIHESMLENIKFNESGALIKGQIKENIKVKVYLGSIKSQVEPAKKKFPTMNTDYIEEMNVKLIASVNQVIRLVGRYILTQYEIIIVTDSPNSKLIFKCLNQEQYMYGNQAIGNYDCVRECLKEDRILQIEIIQSDITREKDQFQKFIFYRSLQDLNKGQYDSFPWNQLILQEHCGFFMWYRVDAQFIDPKQYLQVQIESCKKQLEKRNKKVKINIQLRRRQRQRKIPRFLLKQNIKIFIEKRRAELQKKLVSIEGSTIYSGQCCFLYSFQIIGINNITSLLQQKQQKNQNKGQVIKAQNKNRRPLTKFSIQKQQNQQINSFSTPLKRYNQFVVYKKNGNFSIIPFQISVIAELYYNGQPLSAYLFETPTSILDNTVFFKHKFQCEQCLSELMLETNLVFKIKFISKQGQYLTFGVGVLKIFDEYGFLKQGQQIIELLPHENVNPLKIGCYNEHYQELQRKSFIKIMLPKFKKPVRWTLSDPQSLKLLGFIAKNDEAEKKIQIDDKMHEVEDLLKVNPLKMLKYTKQQKQILRNCKKYYKHQSNKLINYLYSVNWKNSLQIAQAYKCLEEWAPLKPLQGLFLLTPRLSDEKVRFFAVKALEKMSSNDFCLYANQITQALVSFDTHDNPLINLILQRSCIDPFVTGKEYFWQFRNRLIEEITNYRFSMYMEMFIFICPIRSQLDKQVKINDQLIKINKQLIDKTEGISKFETKNEKFQSMITNIQSRLMSIDSDKYDGEFSFPIRFQKKFKYIVPSQSSMFDSKKLPFALACSPYKNQSSSYRIMFKSGDDIKQDHLILQLFTIFDNLWKEKGLDFKMNIYRVLPTGNEIGFIEIVPNSYNSSKVHDQHGKGIGAFDQEATKRFLQKTYEGEKDNFRRARQNYIRSNAGYLVATYILGIGDRHSGNYMIQKSGKFFHIDFGHILGKFKSKFNIKRERTPFVFTTENAQVMGGQKSKDFARFQLYCCQAYNIIRKNAHLLINLLMMMVGAEIPQLPNFDPINYAIEKLNLEMSEHQASEHLIQEIKSTLQNETSKYNNFFHEFVRNG